MIDKDGRGGDTMTRRRVVELNCDNEALARLEAESLGDGLDRATGVAVVEDLSHRRLGMAHRVLAHLGTVAGAAEDALALVEQALADGRLTVDGSFRVRVRGIGGSAPAVERLERDAGTVIHDTGAEVDLEAPDQEIRLVYSDGRWFLGRLLHETEGFGARPPTDNPFFKPGAMGPARARALVNVASGHGGATLLDPMCGTGGFLVEAEMLDGRPFGCDVQPEMVAGARRNLRELVGEQGDHRGASLAVADARRLPLEDDAVDRGLTDLPYGRASRVAADDGMALARDALAELRRVVAGRVVVVADASLEAAARDAGYDVAAVVEDRVHRSLTRRIHVLEPA